MKTQNPLCIGLFLSLLTAPGHAFAGKGDTVHGGIKRPAQSEAQSQVESSDTCEVRVEDFLEFFGSLSSSRSARKFERNLETLKSRMTAVYPVLSEPMRWQLWLPLQSGQNEVWFSLYLIENHFDSQFASQSDLEQLLSLPAGLRFYSLKLSESNEESVERVIFEVIFDERGSYQELLHLQKASVLPGKEVFRMMSLMSKSLGIPRTVLRDEAKYCPDSSGSAEPYFLRRYLPISSASGQTFYGELGNFKPMGFAFDIHLNSEVLPSQSKDTYSWAVQKVRGLTLEDWYNRVLDGNLHAQRKAKLKALIATYLKIPVAQYFQYTVHHLAKEVVQRWKSPQNNAAVARDFGILYALLSPLVVDQPAAHSAAFLEFNRALEIIDQHRIWSAQN